MLFSGDALRFSALLLGGGCVATAGAATFADDLAFLQKHTPALVLTTNEGRSSIVITPALQGRVMTSTGNGLDGRSHGWLNRPVIARGAATEAGNPYGGEDRFWLAPMGGQFSLFYPPAAEFNDDHWRVPAGLDQGAYTLVAQGADFASFRHTIEVENFVGTRFTVEVNRRINLLTRPAIEQQLGLAHDPTLGVVGFESVNNSINRGEYPNGFTGPQARPWEGDVVSCYNNGPFSDTFAPPADASCYELESCSPVKALGRGEAITHTHQMYHFEGTPAQLDPIAQIIVDAATAEIRTALR